MSGLHINATKSSIYASGSNVSDLLSTDESLGLRAGTLPIRYLGMPLTTKTLTAHDYEPLIDKIRGRMLCWDDTKGSWIWRKLLKLRDVAYSYFRMDMRDGISCHFWLDDWLGKGRLIDITGAVGTLYLGVQRHAKVSEVVSLENWNIRGRRSRRFHELYNAIMAVPPPQPGNGRDVILWRHSDDDYRDNFSCKNTWDQLRVKRPKVDWHRVVWFPQDVPRHSFMTWLAIKNRLSTGDRMRQWGMIQGCKLCGERDETRDHLFFACPFAYSIWEGPARRLLGNGVNPDWQ
ncbi:uncharacterized protein LOC108846863 [Raphanus sativus]|uniref:Uncharacterized protein LOC108846863 n=1 Tax=Raphanus sativus TaxID=3726 RepID=A0A6J0MTQ0_RAPSA|nr:uncharacterized protein LOC108846863 [Raphanus sativus]